LKTTGHGDGGKGGEFFYKSFDNKLIIKTINEKELKVFKDILKDYSNHMRKYPNSLIARIYGVYKFNFKKEKQTQVIILMENLCKVSSRAVWRTFDMKGSKYNREVLVD